MCYSDCSFTHTELNRTLQYDFGPMGSTGSVMNGPSFTSKGTKYYHLFNISLCGTQVYTYASGSFIKFFSGGTKGWHEVPTDKAEIIAFSQIDCMVVG